MDLSESPNTVKSQLDQAESDEVKALEKENECDQLDYRDKDAEDEGQHGFEEFELVQEIDDGEDSDQEDLPQAVPIRMSRKLPSGRSNANFGISSSQFINQTQLSTDQLKQFSVKLRQFPLPPETDPGVKSSARKQANESMPSSASIDTSNVSNPPSPPTTVAAAISAGWRGIKGLWGGR